MTRLAGQGSPVRVFDHNATIAKLLFLAVMAIALCTLGPMTLFAPVPLAIAFLLYGRTTTFIMCGLTVGLLWGASIAFKPFPGFVVGVYLAAFVYAILVAEIIFRNINPVRGLIYAGVALVVLGGSLLIGYNQKSAVSLKTEITQSVTSMMSELKKQKSPSSSELSSEEQRAIDDFVNKPEVLAHEIYSMLPAAVFVFSFIGLWVSLYVTLRNSLVWRYRVLYTYDLKDLTYFKVPEFFVWPLILSLGLLLGAGEFLPKEAEMVGRNLLYSLGVFYLFQGFGVYNDFLKYLKIGGFVKTLFIAFTLILAAKYLALLGIFDLWFNFRKFFTNSKKDEGDTI